MTGGPVTVRPVRPEEFGGLGELTAAVYEREKYADHSYLPILRDVASRVGAATQLVAADPEGRVLGGVTLAFAGSDYAERAGDGEAVLRMLVVDPAARGLGVGRLLVQDCLDRAVAAGCHRVRLSTQPTMLAAHRLYERMGFRRAPNEDWTPMPGLDLLAYVLDLPVYCDHCGRALADSDHEPCRAARALEPPRWCARCRRRMVVQVTPTSWTARCVEHGEHRGHSG